MTKLLDQVMMKRTPLLLGARASRPQLSAPARTIRLAANSISDPNKIDSDLCKHYSRCALSCGRDARAPSKVPEFLSSDFECAVELDCDGDPVAVG
jgi:hypothetical protein